MGKANEPKPIRFYVEWHPTAEIEMACFKEGMRTNDGSSFWDWVDPSNYRKTQIFRDFDEAVKFALSVESQDCFGGGRVYRQEQSVVKDGKRSFIRWDDECFWDGIDSTHQPDINKPDEWCDT